MAIYQVDGGCELSGTIHVGGSKNATLPIICATLLTSEVCLLKNVPDISDVYNLIKILEEMGSKIEFKDHVLSIDNSNLNPGPPNPELVKKFRASFLLVGPLLARFKKVVMPFPGGDKIGARPIGTHISAMEELGANIIQRDGLFEVSAAKISGKRIILTEMSVMATENVIMAAVLAEGKSTIHLAATEPHVQDLCRMLNLMGAKISGIGNHDLFIDGVESLHGAEHTIIFDNEVASSFINLAAATRSEILVDNIQPDYLNGALIQWKIMNVNLEVSKNAVMVRKPLGAYKAAKIKTSIYPGLLTDYVPPFAVLATQAEGVSLVHEWMYDGRLGYIHELSKMGASAHLLDPHRAEIEGPTPLHGTNVSALDVRSGMVLLIASLVAEGQSMLHDIEHIERGYEDIVKKLGHIGAKVKRI